MKTFDLKLNDEKNAFICLDEDQNKDAINYFVEKNMKAKLVLEKEVSRIFQGYYFGGIIGFVHELGMYPRLAKYDLNYRKDGFSLVDAYHELLKRDFNGISIDTGKGIERIGKSIAVKDSKKFTDYIERISAYTSENFGVPAPTPDEYRRYSNKGKQFSRFYIDNQDLFAMQLGQS